MWWTVREAVTEGLWRAAEELAVQSEARDVDFAACRPWEVEDDRAAAE
jgi:hypothetical protein